MPHIFSTWCHPGRRYARFGRVPRKNRRPVPVNQVPQSGEATDPAAATSTTTCAATTAATTAAPSATTSATAAATTTSSSTAATSITNTAALTQPKEKMMEKWCKARPIIRELCPLMKFWEKRCHDSDKVPPNRGGLQKTFMYRLKLVLRRVESYLERILRKKETDLDYIRSGDIGKRGVYRHTTKRRFIRRCSFGRRDRIRSRRTGSRHKANTWEHLMTR